MARHWIVYGVKDWTTGETDVLGDFAHLNHAKGSAAARFTLGQYAAVYIATGSGKSVGGYGPDDFGNALEAP